MRRKLPALKKKQAGSMKKKKLLTRKEKLGLTPRQQEIAFKKISKQFKKGEYQTLLLKRKIIYKLVKGKKKKIIQFDQIPLEKFSKKGYYKVYIEHKETGLRRLVALGKLQHIPVRSRMPEKYGALLTGRTFKPIPLPKKKRGRWIPVQNIINTFDKELRKKSKDIKIESGALIIPNKRYFHKEWNIFSDSILKGTQRVKQAMAHVIVKFEYPFKKWINKQFVPISFFKPIMVKNLNNYRERFEDVLNTELEALHPNADDVSIITINGFLPFTTGAK